MKCHLLKIYKLPWKKKQQSIFGLAVIVAALGYFVDIYDLLLFSIIRVPSLKTFGLDDAAIAKDGLKIINIQMMGLLVGGIFWGYTGRQERQVERVVRFHHFYTHWEILQMDLFILLTQYAAVRFITGFGLAGELGAGITLVSELLSKEKRGIGTALVAGIGLTGAVFAFFIKQNFEWRTCYFIGGGLGFLLLFLRVGVLESGMFKSVQESNIVRGDFLCCFPMENG